MPAEITIEKKLAAFVKNNRVAIVDWEDGNIYLYDHRVLFMKIAIPPFGDNSEIHELIDEIFDSEYTVIHVCKR